MAIRYTILKKTRTQVKIKIIGSGSVTIPFSDLALPDETVVSPECNLSFVHWSLDQNNGVGIIYRGGTPTQYLYGTDEWSLSQESSIIDNELNNEEIAVEIQGPNGLIFLSISKHGYKEPDTQAWDLDRNSLP